MDKTITPWPEDQENGGGWVAVCFISEEGIEKAKENEGNWIDVMYERRILE